MDEWLYRKIIDECSHYKSIERILLYMNNEPLTDPYLIERINYAKVNISWASIHILTNGSLLTDEIAEKLINSELDWIGISFHGICKDTIKTSMGIPYEESLSRINNFIDKAKIKKSIRDYIMITFLKHKYLTDEEKNNTIEYWKKKGIERISYFESPISRAGNVEDLGGIYKEQRIIGCKSIWTDEMIHIVEDGKVVLCCMDWRRKAILGDLSKESISDIWNNQRKRIWSIIKGYEDMPSDFLCKNCEESILEKDEDGVLLVMLPPWGVDVPPLGLSCISSYLAEKDIAVKVFDFNIELYNLVPGKYKYLWSMNYADYWRDSKEYPIIRQELNSHIEYLIEQILCLPHRIVGFSLPTNCSDFLLAEIVKRIKKKDKKKKIVLGGASVSIKEQRIELLKFISDFVDYCVVGEGEEVFYRFAKDMLTNNAVQEMKGLIIKDRFDNDIDKAKIPDFNNLPFPKFQEFNLSKYTVPQSLPIEFSRGCIGNCPFCDFKSVFPNFKTKEPQYILKQIRFYIEKYKINHLTIVDSAVNGDIKHLGQICDVLINNGVNIKLSALAIPRREMDRNLLSKMKKAGFYRLEYGLESGSNKILKSMRKIFTSQIAEQVIRDTHQVGIKTFIYIIVGYPSETEKDFNKTKEFIKRNSHYITMIKSINPLYVMAGSEIARNPSKFGVVLPLDNRDRTWYVNYGNNHYEIRKKRVFELKVFFRKIGVPFTEEAESLEFTTVSLEKVVRREANSEIKRSIYKWVVLISVGIYTFFYIVYFWIFMLLRNKVLLGGRRN
jgi:radical SAM superfamily enzyme YgiQ (UPF0313 family)/MoaA/NifB/PqqE/SkfB family radical SAM enzyme